MEQRDATEERDAAAEREPAGRDVFVARQPIHARDLSVAAYELLFRDSAMSRVAVLPTTGPRAAAPGGVAPAGGPSVDGEQATGRVLHASLLTIGLDALTEGHPAYVNFLRELLLSERTLQLPRESLVIEILEDVEPDDEVLAACRRLRAAGFTLALDDFAFAPSLEPLVELVTIIKLELPAIRLDERGEGARLALLRRRGKTLLAEKVETPGDFERARRMGCDLFQGYLWGRPEVRPGRQIALSDRAYLALLTVLADRHADTQEMKEIIRSDPARSQALLRYIHAGLFRWSSRVDSVHRALVLLGRDEIRRWAAMLSLTGSFGGLPPALARSAAVRGRQLELLAATLGAGEHATDLFFAGLFSRADEMLALPLAEALDEVPIPPASREAILEPQSRFGRALAAAVASEVGDRPALLVAALASGLRVAALDAAYREACAWADRLLGASRAPGAAPGGGGPPDLSEPPPLAA